MILSIIIPTYNCEKYIEEVITSVTCQLCNDCELILVDDGSVDNTRDILKNYIDKQDNVKVLFNEHKGASGSRNVGIDIARGEYITFVDCDDRLRSGFIEDAIAIIEDRCDLFIFGIERIFYDGSITQWTVTNRYFDSITEFADEIIRGKKFLVYSNCNKFYRRDIVEKLKLRFDESCEFGEDRLFNYTYLSSCNSIVTSDSIMLEYVQRELNSMSTRHYDNYFDIVMTLNNAKVKCFTQLSHNTTSEEKEKYRRESTIREIQGTLDRFKEHPKEAEENLPKIKKFLEDNQDIVIEHELL